MGGSPEERLAIELSNEINREGDKLKKAQTASIKKYLADEDAGYAEQLCDEELEKYKNDSFNGTINPIDQEVDIAKVLGVTSLKQFRDCIVSGKSESFCKKAFGVESSKEESQ